MRAVGGLRDAERDADALGEPLVGRDAELADRLLVPEEARLGESVAEIHGIGEIERG